MEDLVKTAADKLEAAIRIVLLHCLSLLHWPMPDDSH